MCCPPTKGIKGSVIQCMAIGGLHEDELFMRHYTINGTDQCQNGSSIPFLLHIESHLDRLRFLSPTHGGRSQQQSSRYRTCSDQFISTRPNLLNATCPTEIRKNIIISMFMAV